MAKFNYREITRKVASSPIVTKRMTTIMQKKFDASKEDMLEEFDNHPVTLEINAGIDADNISDTLPDVPNGNLFAFIGFDAFSDPISPVREILKDEMVLTRSQVESGERKIKYKFSVRVPTEHIEQVSPLPFETGQSWVTGIEKGISGFGNFLAKKFNNPPSRSTGGIQTEHEIREGEFHTVPYLSKLLRDFTARLKR